MQDGSTLVSCHGSCQQIGSAGPLIAQWECCRARPALTLVHAGLKSTPGQNAAVEVAHAAPDTAQHLLTITWGGGTCSLGRLSRGRCRR